MQSPYLLTSSNCRSTDESKFRIVYEQVRSHVLMAEVPQRSLLATRTWPPEQRQAQFRGLAHSGSDTCGHKIATRKLAMYSWSHIKSVQSWDLDLFASCLALARFSSLLHASVLPAFDWRVAYLNVPSGCRHVIILIFWPSRHLRKATTSNLFHSP